MRTSSPRRWIWMRMPSSFHSTDARSKPATASADALGRRGEHREDRAEELEADVAQALLALGHRDLGGAREVAGEHQRAARELRRDAGRLRDRVDHQPGERALPQLAGEQPLDEVGLVLGRALEQARRGSRVRRAADPLPVAAWIVGDRPVEVVDRRATAPPRRATSMP